MSFTARAGSRSCRMKSSLLTLAAIISLLPEIGRARESIDLAGQWGFRLDRGDAGESEKWFTQALPGKIRLPGSLQEQGFGDDPSVATQWTGSIKDRSWFDAPEFEKFRQPGQVRIPFWLQPVKHYTGAAWYQRDIEIPDGWTDRQVMLHLERCHWFTDVWIDDRHVGSGESLSVPHRFNLPGDLAAGRHRLTIRVDNRLRFNVGPDAHSVSDHTQSNWNGLTGGLLLTASPKVWIDSVKAYPGNAPHSVRIVATIRNATGKPIRMGRLQVGKAGVAGEASQVPVRAKEFRVESESVQCEMEYVAGGALRPWDEFHPELYRLQATMDATVDGRNVRDQTDVIFGARTVAAKGTRLVINGRPIFLRGTLECCIFPQTGYPPTDVPAWKRIMEICRAHGLNHLRFHSWCPPEAAFLAADESGFYLQVELPAWNHNMGKDPPRDEFLRRELDRILDAYGNHPSFILMTMGNELSGGKDDYMTDLVEHAKSKDPRRLYASSTHEYRLPVDEFLVTMRANKKLPVRGLRAPGTDWDFTSAISDERIPVIAHEVGQHCVWPDFSEIARYTGVLKAGNFELFRERLAERGMLEQARHFLMSSGKLQTLCYKEEIEAMMRTPGFGGFQLLDLHDFPGQGTALVGILNAFWEQKGYTSPEEFRRFCAPTVPLARITKRLWTHGENLAARIELAHFGASDLTRCAAEWTLTDDHGKLIGKGSLPVMDVPAGGLTTLGTIHVDLDRVKTPARVNLAVSIPKTRVVNDWNLWVYPDTPPEPVGGEVVVSSEFDGKTVAALTAGGRVVLLPPFGTTKGRRETWAPIFWNSQWFKGGNNHSLGLLCDVKHPALAGFPSAFHSDWQWHDLMNRSVAIDLSAAPPGLHPIVQVVPDWNQPRREALLFECKVGKGRFLMCSADLHTKLDDRPAARQLRRSLLTYAASPKFNPVTEMSADQVRSLLVIGGVDEKSGN
jgi:hypothetical protein